MAADISSILRELSRAGSQVKQGRIIAATQATRTALNVLISGKLLRAEHDEFVRLLTDACGFLGNNAEVRRLFPLSLEFRVGEERALMDNLVELQTILEENATAGAADMLKDLELRKQGLLHQGRRELEAGDVPAAKKVFSAMEAEFPGDAAMNVDIADSYIQHNLYEEAAGHLEKAGNMAGASAHVYNRLGISLRKIKLYDAAETNFKKALQLEPSDPNLHFNLGRVHLDRGNWAEAQKAAENAFALDASFHEARKLAAYAAKKAEEK